ncbi:hypothetical protein B0H12DRAFT_1077738 [Mycena haematopus]|nr:hypothetical protein B0H12DRAFT_1077738 [Mycena haematopus]
MQTDAQFHFNAIQKVVSNKRAAERAKRKTVNNNTGEPTPKALNADKLAMEKLLGLTTYTGRDKFSDDRHDVIYEFSKTLEGSNAGGRFRHAESLLWAKEDQAQWEAAAAADEDVDWEEAEAVPDDIQVRQPFKKQNMKLVDENVNAMLAWAGQPLKDYLAIRDRSSKGPAPVFPVTAEDISNIAPKALAETVTKFLTQSYEAAFGSGEIPWAAIVRKPSEYYNTENFPFSFTSNGLAELTLPQWYDLSSTLSAVAGVGTAGFFRKAPSAQPPSRSASPTHPPPPPSRSASPTRPPPPPSRSASPTRPPPPPSRSASPPRPSRSVSPAGPPPSRAASPAAPPPSRAASPAAPPPSRAASPAGLPPSRPASPMHPPPSRSPSPVHPPPPPSRSPTPEKVEEPKKHGSEDPPKKRGRKRKAPTQLTREEDDAAEHGEGSGSAVRRTARARKTPEEAKLEREKQLAAATGVKAKPSWEYVVRSPAKPKQQRGKRFYEYIRLLHFCLILRGFEDRGSQDGHYFRFSTTRNFRFTSSSISVSGSALPWLPDHYTSSIFEKYMYFPFWMGLGALGACYFPRAPARGGRVRCQVFPPGSSEGWARWGPAISPSSSEGRARQVFPPSLSLSRSRHDRPAAFRLSRHLDLARHPPCLGLRPGIRRCPRIGKSWYGCVVCRRYSWSKRQAELGEGVERKMRAELDKQ